MNTSVEHMYVIGLDFLYFHTKFRSDEIAIAEKMTFEVAFLQFSGYFRTETVTSATRCWKEYYKEEPDVTLNGCMSCNVKIPIFFVNVKLVTRRNF